MIQFFKRIAMLMIPLICMVLLAGCGEPNEPDWQCVESYELISVQVDRVVGTSFNASGKYLMCYGSFNASSHTYVDSEYIYWYKREDGGHLERVVEPDPENTRIVIYEDDTVTPKVEVYMDMANTVDGYWDYMMRWETHMVEYRFTIPSGSLSSTFTIQ